MLPETKRDRVIYLAVIPILTALIAGTAGALLQAESCSVVGASEVRALLENAELNGEQKIEFMKVYMELTDRPWALVRSIVSWLSLTSAILIGLWAASGGFKRA